MNFSPYSHLTQAQSPQVLDSNITDYYVDSTESEPLMPFSTEDITILIIESELVAALNLHFQLLNLGYQVGEIVQTHEAAIKKVQDLHVDLIIMQAHLEEGEDSVEFAKMIYREFQIQIIFLTTPTEYKILNQRIENYPFGCVVQPFQEGNLDAAVRLLFLHTVKEKMLKENIGKERNINDIKSQFISAMSHELRNPLSCVMMIFEILIEREEELSLDARQMYLKRGQEMIRELNKFLDDALVIGEIEHGEFRCHPTSINVVHFCSNLVEDLRYPHRNNQQLNFTVQAHDQFGALFYEIDPKLLRHILTNLLSNAIKYSPSDSEIDFRLICTPEAVTFQIQDYGIGIPHRDRDRLFTAFNRATNVGSVSGTGLGLAIVKQCVDAHSGTIKLESEEGIGTTVTVQFRVHAAQENCSSGD